MQNVQYITDAAGYKTAVILPIEDYEMLKEMRDEDLITIKINDFDYLQEFLSKQLVLSILDKTFEYLEIPLDHSKKRTKDASLFLFSLVELFYYSKDLHIDRENYTITLKNAEFTKFLISIEYKTIQTQRNENLIPYLENSKKSIVEICQHPPSGSGLKGTSYKLNFLEAMENAIDEFFDKSKIGISEIINIIEFSKRIKFSELNKANNKFKFLWQTITHHLKNLPQESKIYQSSSARGASNYHRKI